MAGRPRKTEPAVALDAAMKAFWAKGFEATSMADLTEATGLHKASLYQTFGDKRALFVSALESYLQSTIAALKAVREQQPDPVLAVAQSADVIISKCSEGRGCMAVNSLVEMAPYDPEIGKLLKQFLQRLDRFLAGLIQAGIASKHFNKHTDAAAAARLMSIFIFGLTTNMAAGMSANKARKLVAEQMHAVLPPGKRK